MERIIVRIDEAAVTALDRVASEEAASRSAVIREAIDLLLAARGRRR